MESILSILSGGTAGAILVWLFRGWISERLKQSIQHEYSQKLETHKAELNTRIQEFQHENQLRQLRTSLFFDHQRDAFSAILAKIAEVNQAWLKEEHDPDEGFTGGVPYKAYKELMCVYHKHQLFLDASCIAAMELLFECYRDSFPSDDRSGDTPVPSSCIGMAYEATEYLYPRIVELFQSKICYGVSGHASKDIALLGSIRILNRYHFQECGIPIKGGLSISRREHAAGAVIKAEKNLEELKLKLKEFHAFLRQDDGFFHEAEAKISRYLEMLE